MLPGSELNGMPSYDQLVSHRLLEPTSLCPYDDLHRKLRCALDNIYCPDATVTFGLVPPITGPVYQLSDSGNEAQWEGTY